MSDERRQQLVDERSAALRGIEGQALRRIGRIWESALSDTIRKVFARLEQIAEQPDYDPRSTPGAFLGSTPDGPADIDPFDKNAASIYLQGQLIQDLRTVLADWPLNQKQQDRLDRELSWLFEKAADIGEEYAQALTRATLEPALQAIANPPEREPSPWPDRSGPYQEGQRFTRLFDLEASVAAAERDFKSLAENYRLQRDLATSVSVAASKDYYAKWWGNWGETVSFETSRQLAAGLDLDALAANLRRRLPDINQAFRNRHQTIARTEGLLAAGVAQERCYRRLRVGFVQVMATEDERVCDWCAPRMGCIYWLGSIRAPFHPNCRCATAPVTLENLAIQNAIATDPADRWEEQAREMAANTIKEFQRANGPEAVMRPTGGPGEARSSPRDFPLMEKTGLPGTVGRSKLPSTDPLNQAAEKWPAGNPVWCPRRGWLDQDARRAYEAVVAQVATL